MLCERSERAARQAKDIKVVRVEQVCVQVKQSGKCVTLPPVDCIEPQTFRRFRCELVELATLASTRPHEDLLLLSLLPLTPSCNSPLYISNSTAPTNSRQLYSRHSFFSSLPLPHQTSRVELRPRTLLSFFNSPLPLSLEPHPLQRCASLQPLSPSWPYPNPSSVKELSTTSKSLLVSRRVPVLLTATSANPKLTFFYFSRVYRKLPSL